MTNAETDVPAPPPAIRNAPVEIADGVFVIPDGRVPLVPNIGIVVGAHAALVVDTGMGPRNGAIVRRFADEIRGDRALLLTITHFHPEHGFGAQAFADATILYNRDQHLEFRAKARAYLEMFRGFGPGVADQLEDVELVEPRIVYSGDADLDLGGRRVQLRAWGLAHTRGDQVVWLPDEGILFAGDLVENRFFPIFPWFPPDDADVDGARWISVLERLEELRPAVVVPGHGEAADASVIAAARECLTALRDETRRLAAEGVSSDDAVAALEPTFRERHPDWEQPEWIAFAVRSFHAAS
jgi:glyoxylase-like metal-dependent hydrolase (beta-lactamase superfamily II)